MIDFRYHVVSIVAVLFALAIGIIFGSGFLGGALLDRLQTQLGDLDDRNRQLLQDVGERNDALEGYTEFAEAARPWLLRNVLAGEEVVLMTVEGTDEGAVAGIRDSIEQAGGTIPSTLTATGRLELVGPDDRTELRSLLGTVARAPDDLRRVAGSSIGSRIADAASISPEQPGGGPGAEQRLQEMLQGLSDAGYLTIDMAQDEVTIPRGSLFVVVAGSRDAPPWPAQDYVKAMTVNLSANGGTVLTGEPLGSVWGIVQSICDDGQASDDVSTVDQADTAAGQVAAILGFDYARSVGVGHWGTASCATEVIPPRDPAG
ncbi:copper transporter [soil metagenome]